MATAKHANADPIGDALDKTIAALNKAVDHLEAAQKARKEEKA